MKADHHIPIGVTLDGKVPVSIDVARLVETRALIQANSGAGKSSLQRLLCEAAAPHIQTIIIDPEGDMRTLREMVDMVVVGAGGDVPCTVSSAAKLARHLVEMNLSAVVDISELNPLATGDGKGRKPSDREEYVRLFLSAIMAVPRQHWHPVLILIDECQDFCPQKGMASSSNAVIQLLIKGRKRGFCAILSTLRIGDLNKAAAAQCNNVFVGRTIMDTDQRRAGDMLGQTADQRRDLRRLSPGTFWAHGPALGLDVFDRVVMHKPKTSPPKRGSHQGAAAPAPSGRIKSVLPQLEAAIDAQSTDPLDMDSALAKIRELEAQVKGADALAKDMRHKDDTEEIAALRRDLNEARNKVRSLEHGQKTAIKQAADKVREAVSKVYEDELAVCQGKAEAVFETLKDIAKPNKMIRLRKSLEVTREALDESSPEPVSVPSTRTETRRPVVTAVPSMAATDVSGGKRQLMLRWAARHFPNAISKAKLAGLCGMSVTGGTFKTYMGAMRSEGLVHYPTPGVVAATHAGLAAAGDVAGLPTGDGIIAMWRDLIGDGKKRALFDALLEHREGLSQEELCERAGMEPTGGTYKTYMGSLRTLGVVNKGRPIKLTDELWEAIDER